MNEIKIFENPQFGAIRTFTDNGGKLWFCGSDVANGLGYSNPRDAVRRHCRCVAKHDVPHPQAPDKNIEMAFISEGDVYRLITHSKLPNAVLFESWVFDEVVPSIRKHGAYMTPETIQQAVTNPDFIISLCEQLKAEQNKNTALIEQNTAMQPKALFADSVCASSTSILIGELAKILKQNGVATGQNKLFAWMRDNGYLIRRKGADYNMPTQRSMEMQLFEIKETVVSHADGHTSINKTPKVTGKGQMYFINKLRT